MSMQVKPHLKEVEELYNKILDFESGVNLKNKYDPVEGMHHYAKDDVRTVIDALSRSLDFSPRELSDLENAMLSGNIDFMRFVHEHETMPEEESQLLYIISRPFFKSMQNAVDMDQIFWQDGNCPVCTAKPVLSVIEKESQRKYFCSFCSSVGYYTRIGCPNCLTEKPTDITVISLEGEEGMRADICDNCGTYCKSFESSMTADYSMDELDIMSIPLDIIAQNKGYRRHSPNPVGMRRMNE